MDLPVAEAAVDRFRAGLAAIWPEGANDPRQMLGLAVSGGPDSLGLLLLACRALPGRVKAATVDHALRPESAAEAAEVGRICAELAISHATLTVTVAPGNVQAEARSARYAALAEWADAEDVAALATGHQANDQAETLIMRLNRASGVAGLAGARARGLAPGSKLVLLRPVLDWRRAELGALVSDAGLVAADDPSNANDRFDRVKVRKALAKSDWLDVSAIAQSAAHLAEADAALEWMSALEWRSCVKKEPMGMKYRPQAPRAVALRVVARIVRELDGVDARGGAIARLVDALVAGHPSSIGNLVARPNSGGWSFTKAPVRAVRKARPDPV